MRTLTAAFRLLRVLLHALHGWWIITFLFPRLQPRQREARVQIWAIGMLTCLGIRLQVLGASAAAGPVLLVSNHISWLDILVLHAGVYCRFVSKADVRHWPLVGALATGAGTLYIERASRRDAMRVVHQMADALRGGDVLAVFPEGTTVYMRIGLDSKRTAEEIFQQFTSAPEDYDFSRTIVPMRLAQYGDEQLVSRSQAKRLIARFERFRTVVLDFQSVTEIGRAFADELFRVYHAAHPNIELVPINLSEQVERMWRRSTTSGNTLDT